MLFRCTCRMIIFTINIINSVGNDIWMFVHSLYIWPRDMVELVIWKAHKKKKVLKRVLCKLFGCALFILTYQKQNRPIEAEALGQNVPTNAPHLFQYQTWGREDVTMQILPGDWQKNNCYVQLGFVTHHVPDGLALPAYKKHPLRYTSWEIMTHLSIRYNLILVRYNTWVIMTNHRMTFFLRNTVLLSLVTVLHQSNRCLLHFTTICKPSK